MVELVAGRELAERDRAVELREPLVEDRDGLALPEHPPAPQDVGAHAHSALPDDGGPAHGRHEAHADERGPDCAAHPHGRSGNQTGHR